MRQKKDHIAIIGAGFSGLAAAYYFSQAGRSVTIYDPAPVGENASGISAGLLHHYTGPKANPHEDAEQKLLSTLELLQTSSQALGKAVFKKTGLFRPALYKEQEAFYRKRADEEAAVHWWPAEEVQTRCPHMQPFPGIWISNGYQIDTKDYLEGLWQACSTRGAQWVKKTILSTNELEEQHIIVTTGASLIKETSNLPIHPIKGQILEIEWEHNPPFPISANLYFVPSTTQNRCFIGGTFEHRFGSTEPDQQIAESLLFPKIETLFPNSSPFKVVGIKAALRASTPNRLPILKKIDSRTTVLVGMGSKGLLHHAYYAKKLLEY